MSDNGLAVAGATAGRVDVNDVIRAYFRADPSRMTLTAARKFRVPERDVLEALVGQWPITRLRVDAFHEIARALAGLGPVRVFVRSRAAVLETVGTFGGFSETGAFLNVQTDTLDMHILPGEVASIYAVEKIGHDTEVTTYSLQFFDALGESAFKVFLWEDYPEVPAARIAAYRELGQAFAAPSPVVDPEAEVDGERRTAAKEPALSPLAPTPGGLMPPQRGAPRRASWLDEATAAEEAPAPERVPIPYREGVVPGSSAVGEGVLGEQSAPQPAQHLPREARVVRLAWRLGLSAASLVVLYLVGSMFVAPLFWRHYEGYVKLAEAPKHTLTAENGPSDPLNIALLGPEGQVVRALIRAGWNPSDPATFQTCNRYASDLLRDRPYPRAGLGDLYLSGRRQDLVFEKPGAVAKERHGARFWRSDELGRGGLPLWLGAVSLERPADPGHPGRRIGSDLDAERDLLVNDLSRSLSLTEVLQVTGVGPTVSGQTADGDAYVTDGELSIGLVPITGTATGLPQVASSPLLVRIKNRLWSELRPVFTADDEG